MVKYLKVEWKYKEGALEFEGYFNALQSMYAVNKSGFIYIVLIISFH